MGSGFSVRGNTFLGSAFDGINVEPDTSTQAVSNLVMECIATNAKKRPADMDQVVTRLELSRHVLTRANNPAATLSDTQIKLTWSASSGATSYNVLAAPVIAITSPTNSGSTCMLRLLSGPRPVVSIMTSRSHAHIRQPVGSRPGQPVRSRAGL